MSAAAAPPHAGADILIRNGKVITCDRDFRITRAIALKDGRILAVGNDADLAPLADDRTQVIDAAGRTVIPGLIDCHAHLDREGLKPVFPSLAGCRSIDDVLQRIEQLVAASEPGAWIVTMPIGEPPYYWDVPGNLREKRFPTRWELDRVSPKNPVYIRPIWGFWRHTLPISSVANSLALEAAGIRSGMAPPPAAIRFETNQVTGAFNGIIHEDTFMPAVELGYFHMMPRFEHGHRVAGLRDAMRIYNATGTTSIYEEHGCAQELIQAYQAVHAAGDMTVRASLVFSPSWHFIRPEHYAPTLQRWAAWLGNGGLGDDFLRVEGLYVEPGITPENLLRLNASPYTGWSGFNYDCGLPREHIVDMLCEAARNGIRPAALTIDFLDIYEQVNRRVPIADRRWVLGHLRTATPDQIARIRDLGLVMSAHTNRYVYKEGHLVRDEIGRARENDIAPLRSLVEGGVHIGLATDNVPTSLFWPIWEAVTRWNRYSNDAIAPEQALTREQALRCATIEGAHLTCEEDVKGSLEPGKYADLAILSDDPLTCSDGALKDIVALKTIVAGRIVHDREDIA